MAALYDIEEQYLKEQGIDMSRAVAKPETFRIVHTDDGLHLKDSILWLDSKLAGQLSFLSSADEQIKTFPPQVIATEETVKIMEIFRRKPNALVCQYNRPFSIGRLKMELLPSGHALGGASLYLESGKNSLLYAPHIQTQKISINRQLQLKKAKILILSANNPDPIGVQTNHNREKEALLEKINHFRKQNKWPIIYCETLPVAQELTKYLCDQSFPLSVHHQIYKINKIYETYGSSLGNYSQYNNRRSKNKIVLLPIAAGKNSKLLSFKDRPYFLVRSNHAEIPKFFRHNQLDEQFSLSSASFGNEFHDVIGKVKPKEIYFFGAYSKQYAKAFRLHRSITINSLYPNDQPVLF